MRRKELYWKLLAGLFVVGSGATILGATYRTSNFGDAWETAANWGGAVPANNGTADLLFSMQGAAGVPTGVTMITQSWNVDSLTWNSLALSSSGTNTGTGFLIASDSSKTLTLRGGGLSNLSGGRIEVSPNLVLAQTQTWNDTSTPSATMMSGPGIWIKGTVSGPGGFVKTGSGAVRLEQANTYQGGTTINGGVVEVSTPAALGFGAVQLNGGSLRYHVANQFNPTVNTMPQNIILGANGGAIYGLYGQNTLAGTISGAGPITLTSTPQANTEYRLFLLSGTNTYTGGTIIDTATVNVTGTGTSLGTGLVTVKNGGVLGLAAPGNLAPGQTVALQPGGVVALNSTAFDPAAVVETDPAKTTGGAVALGVNWSTPINLAAIGNGRVALGAAGQVAYTATTLGAGVDGVYRLGTSIGATGSSSTISDLAITGGDNVLTGANSLEVVGSVRLMGANNYTGGTLLGATPGSFASLKVGHDLALGTGTITVGGQPNFSAYLTGWGGVRTLANPLVFAPNAQRLLPGSLIFTGPVDLGGGTQVMQGSATFTNTIGNGSLILVGSNMQLSGANTFTNLIATATTLSVGSDANLGAAGSLLKLSGTLRATASFSSSRPMEFTGNLDTIDTGVHHVTLSGTVSSLGLTKQGTGTFSLRGGGKTVGRVDVTAGTLSVEDNGISNTMPVDVRGGAFLGGNGSVGATTLFAGGTLAPGLADAPGSLQVNGNLAMRAQSGLRFDLGPGAFDEIVLKLGSLHRSGAAGPLFIEVFDAGGLAAGQTYTLIDWTGGSSMLSAADFQVVGYLGGSVAVVGSTLQYTAAVPEPTAGVLLAAGAVLAGFGRRGRRDPVRK